MKLCCKCHDRPRYKDSSYCEDCRKEYNRGWRQTARSVAKSGLCAYVDGKPVAWSDISVKNVGRNRGNLQ